MKNSKKLIRITTVPGSLKSLLYGQLHYMNDNGFDVIGVSSPGKRLEDVRRDQGIRTIPIPMERDISILKDLKALWKLYRLFKIEKPDIVHTHTPKAGTLGMVASILAGVPIRLHTVAGLPLMEITGLKRCVLNWVEKLTYSCATMIYPNSKGLYDFILEQRFTKAEKLKVIGNGSSNGIDTSRFDPSLISEKIKQNIREELNIRRKDFIYLYVGRVVSDKGINELVQAFAMLHDEFNDIHLIIVGSYENHLDPLQAETKRIIDSNPNIYAVGYKDDVEKYFAVANVLTFPSYREGFPNVVMQAAAMQLNSIVSNINGCNEIISNGENGWVVPTKNIKLLKEKMRWCYEHQEESKFMGMRSRKLVQEKFETLFLWNELLQEYGIQLDKIY